MKPSYVPPKFKIGQPVVAREGPSTVTFTRIAYISYYEESDQHQYYCEDYTGFYEESDLSAIDETTRHQFFYT